MNKQLISEMATLGSAIRDVYREFQAESENGGHLISCNRAR